MDSEEVEKWDEESERAWKNDNLEVQFPQTIEEKSSEFKDEFYMLLLSATNVASDSYPQAG